VGKQRRALFTVEYGDWVVLVDVLVRRPSSERQPGKR
jgi:hypothetical protein